MDSAFRQLARSSDVAIAIKQRRLRVGRSWMGTKWSLTPSGC